MSASKTPRPQCLQDPPCNAWKHSCGCGFLAAGTLCRHPQERRRFTASGLDITGLPGLYDDDTDHEIVTGAVGPQITMFAEVL